MKELEKILPLAKMSFRENTMVSWVGLRGAAVGKQIVELGLSPGALIVLISGNSE